MNKKYQPVTIPYEGERPGIILDEISLMTEADVPWKDGRAWSLVYYAGKEHDELLKAASNELFSTNYLNPLAFKSLHRMEQEVVHMTADMLQGDKDTVGVMTTGGTESILLAMFCYRQRAKKLHPHITGPEIVAPVTIHPAFDKAAVLFGLHIRKAPVDENRCAIPSAMEELINENTILIVVSAPSYPNGAMDPVEAIADIATHHNLPVHVDACIGGFMLPWIEKLGYDLPAWDLRIKGVTSVSADVHKFGYGAKGASVLLYRKMDYLHYQFIVTTDFPGGIYISPTLLGTRAGGPIAAAWAGMKHLGEKGYMELAGKLMDAAQKLSTGLTAIPGIIIVGKPCMNIISYTTKNNDPDIFVIADKLEEKGWMVDRQQLPDCIHLTVLPTNVDVIDQYLIDLKKAYAYATDHPGDTARGNAAIYGLMARLPFRGMVEKSVKKIMEEMYNGIENNEQMISKKPAWLGLVNKFFSSWTRRKLTRKTSLRGFLFICFNLFLLTQVWSQPYVDLIQLRYTYAVKNKKAAATPFTHLWAGSDIPLKLKGNSYLLLSPYYELWRLDSAKKQEIYPTLHSIAFPIGFIQPIGRSNWAITVIPILRWNGEKLFDESTFQYGGVTFATYAPKPLQKFRLGVYLNADFFGLFVMPLLGADWRIDKKNYLFGLLPGRLSFEHKWSEKLYGGATFRAITNSYRFSNGQFIRLDDNQVSLFLDYYPDKHICVTLEPGFGVFRKIRTGNNKGDYFNKVNWGDGPFIKLSAAYRIRL